MHGRTRSAARHTQRRGPHPAHRRLIARRPPRRVLIAAALISLLALAGLGGARLYASSWLVISDVRVEGAKALDPASLRDLAALTGQRCFSADSAAAVRRLSALPRIKSARVQTHFPHSATISVVEREAIGVWRVGAIAYLVSGDGTVLDAAPPDNVLPVIDASRADVDVRIGDTVDPDPLLVATRVNDFVPRVLGQHIAHIAYDKETGATVSTDNGALVRLGDSKDLDFKLAVWQRLLSLTRPGDIHELDLRYGDRPYYR